MQLIVPNKELNLSSNNEHAVLKKERAYIAPDAFMANNVTTDFIQHVSVRQFNNEKQLSKAVDFTNKKLLVSRTGGMGDFLFIMRSIEQIKRTYKNVHIKFACGLMYQSFVKTFLHHYVDEVASIPFQYADYVKCDYFITFENYPELMNRKELNSYELMADRLHIKLDNDNYSVPISIPDKLHDDVLQISKYSHTVAIQLNATAVIRTWPWYHVRDLIKLFNEKRYEVLLLGALNEINEFRMKTKDDNLRVQCIDGLDKQIASLPYCRAVITPNSVFAYLAESLNIRTYTLCGAFKSELTLKNMNITAIECIGKCFNCNDISANPCTQSNDGFSPCMKAITPQFVFDTVIGDIE